MPSIVELKQERARLVGEARTMIDTAEAANRDFGGEETETYGRIDSEIEALNSRIQRQEQAEQRDRDAAGAAQPDPQQAQERDSLSDQFREMARGERRSLTVDFNQAEREFGSRDLTKGTDTAGGATVPQTFVQQLFEFLTERSAIRQTNVNVLTTSSAEEMLIPKVTAHGSAGTVAEGGTIPSGDPEFGQISLGGHKYGQLLQISSELAADTGVNLLDFIARDAGRALGEATGAHYINGSGTGQPTGILQDTTAGVTAAAADAITADELIDLYFSVIAPYRRNSYWMMNDATLAHVRKLKDNNDQYLWEPALRAGVPDRLLGRPVVTDHNIAAPAADAKSVVFGDFSGYYIRDVGSMRFERSNDFAFDTDLITFRSLMRTDGKLVDTTGAVKHLVQASAV